MPEIDHRLSRHRRALSSIAPILLAALWVAGALTAWPSRAQVAVPPHPPLRILIVSDEVNPHGLPSDQLTQPGEISAALLALPGLDVTGVEAVHEVPTDSIEEATSRLKRPREDPAAYDVLIYFAHRIPNGGDGAARQEAFVTAATSFVASGGGLVSFHHGVYRTAGKESMQSLLGGEATGAVPWNVVEGQNVINISPGHPISEYGVSSEGFINYGDPEVGIATGDFAFFNNTPDERYPTVDLLPDAGEIEPLFASDYDQGGPTHLLGYLHRRPEWRGIVMVYQPGEYEPNALGAGNNLQILVNAIVFTGTAGRGDWLFGDGFETGDLSLWGGS